MIQSASCVRERPIIRFIRVLFRYTDSSPDLCSNKCYWLWIRIKQKLCRGMWICCQIADSRLCLETGTIRMWWCLSSTCCCRMIQYLLSSQSWGESAAGTSGWGIHQIIRCLRHSSIWWRETHTIRQGYVWRKTIQWRDCSCPRGR